MLHGRQSSHSLANVCGCGSCCAQDGDSEWVLFKEEQDRVQILWEHTTWGMFRVLRKGYKERERKRWIQHADEFGVPYWMNNYTGDVVYDDPHAPRGPWRGFDPEDDWVDTDIWVRFIDEWKGVYYKHQFTGELLYERPDYKAQRERLESSWVSKRVRGVTVLHGGQVVLPWG